MVGRRFWNLITLVLALGLGCFFLIVIWSLNASSAKVPVPSASIPIRQSARDNPIIRTVIDYTPRQGESIGDTIAFVLAIDEVVDSHDIEIDGWYAVSQGNDDWEVKFCFSRDGDDHCATFWYDARKQVVAAKDYWARLFLNAAAP